MKSLAIVLPAILCSAFVLPLCFAQEVTFSDQLVITTGADNAYSVFSADLDGDGDCDVLSASRNDDKIAWYENTDGLSSFGPQQIITTSADGAMSVFSADLDGDDDYDVLSAFGNRIAWYRNEGTVGVYEEQLSTTIPETHILRSVYPNPFNPVTTIEVGLPNASDLQVSVFNTLGQEVATLSSGLHQAGYHNFTFDGSDFASGIYFVRALVPGKMNEIRKVVLMK